MAIAKTQTLFSVRKTSLASRLLATVGVRTPCASRLLATVGVRSAHSLI
jgi:hypothetical protein